MHLSGLDVAQVFEEDVGHLHSHTTEVGHKMRARLMARKSAFCIMSGIELIVDGGLYLSI